MQYAVLARKWRPKSLQEMVGQEHILTIIANSLQQQRLHHAYLFCGTRGVGKTTLARIFTKCLNCETGPTATPCNQCKTCQQIDQGIYPDLIEIDAASRTKVEDTRDLLDNVQYAPTSGKYKVYLIDEVHMLSGHSFNALLKTLEEPPEHVKFLLATTDPQKLPITVLSRCLKLSLRFLTVAQISAHLAHVLTQENVMFETTALTEIARAAQGSMRDALSLLDQAIVFCGDTITLEKVSHLLGIETRYLLFDLLEALIHKDDAKIFALIQTMEEKNGDFMRASDDFLHLLFHIALYQKNSQLISQDDPRLLDILPKLSEKISSNDIQLLYQIVLSAKKDLPFAPTLRMGFEMMMLRAMDFYPLALPAHTSSLATAFSRDVRTMDGNGAQAQDVRSREMRLSTNQNAILSPESWPTILPQLNLKGITLTIANQSTIGKMHNNRLELTLSERHRSLCNEKQQQLLEAAIAQYVGHSVNVDFRFIEQQQEKAVPQQKTVEVSTDANLQQLLNMFDADIHRGT